MLDKKHTEKNFTMKHHETNGIRNLSLLGETSIEKKRFLLGIARMNHLNPPPPDPNSGNLVLFFWTSKTTFCAYDRNLFLMMIMMVAMIIMVIILVILMMIMTEMTKKHTITVKFE